MASKMLPRGIPGNRIFPLVGTAWTYWPYVGTGDDLERMSETYLRKYYKFGDIFAERLGDKTVVSLFNPKDIENVYEYDGRLPQRRSHDIILKIRRSFPHMYASGGLTPTNGEEWYNLRRQFLGGLGNASPYFPVVQKTSAEFVEHLDNVRKKHDGMVYDVIEPLHHWALENLTVAILNTRMDAFTFNRKAICNQLITSAKDFYDAVKDAEYSRMWKYFNTKTRQKATQNEFFFYMFVRKHVDEILKRDKSLTTTPGHVPCVLEKFLMDTKKDVRDVIATSSDFILAGLSTTAIAASVTLHHLGLNPEKQELAYEDVMSQWPDEQPLDIQRLRQMNYVNACVLESLRMNPVTIGCGRVLVTNFRLGGFDIKSGTIIITHNGLTGQLDKFVPRPTQFIPERFTLNDPPLRRFVLLPFGHRSRSCIGQDFALMELMLLVAQILRKYRISTKSTPILRTKTILLNFPDSPIDIQLIPRNP